jgi:solute carrier family 25 (mitochondrial folate transporter), member 32
MSKDNSIIKWDYLFSGILAGGTSAAIFHPLELIKIRFQVNEFSKPKLLNYDLINKIKPKTVIKTETKSKVNQAAVYRPSYKNIIDSIFKIYKTENGLRGLYRGVVINTLASGTAWGSYFLVYNTLKQNNKIIQDNLNVNLKTNRLTSILANYTLDATLSGVIIVFITNPLFLIKTRMCLQYAYNDAGVNTSNVVKYRNSYHALQHLLKTDGFFGLYKGIVPGLFGTINGTLQMVSYDLMKQFWLKYKNNEVELNSIHYLVFSGFSKTFAVIMTFPFQVVRARIQDQHRNYTSLTQVVRNLYKFEGFFGFYKGLVPGLLRVTPAASVTFFIYENMLKLLQ